MKPTWTIVCAPGVGEAEHDVFRSAFVQMGEQLLDAKLKHDSESGVVRLEQDADAVDLFIVRNVGENVLKVLLILLNAPAV